MREIWDKLCVNSARLSSFFMSKFKHKEGSAMFDEEILEKIYSDPETKNIPIGHQSTMIHLIERTLEELGVENIATISKSELF